MLTTKAWLFITLGGFGAFYIITWVAARSRERSSEPIAPTPSLGAIGFVTTFFDTLGIGSFATATSIFKLRKLVKDEVLPGTLNVGITLPTIAQAFIYIMMGSRAFLMPVGSARFIRKGSYDVRASLGLALGGIPAVLIAALIVKSLDLYYVRWLVVVVVIYTALSMLRSAASERQSLRKAAQPPALEDVVSCPTKAP